MTFDSVQLFFGMIYLAGFASAIHAVLFVRSPEGTIAWLLSLIFFPYLSLPLYWIFGPRKFQEYVEALTAAEKQFKRAMPDSGMSPPSVCSLFPGELETTSRVLERLGDVSTTSGNDAQLLIDGDETFRAMFKAIEEAQDYILLEFYIVVDDVLGGRLRDALIEKAKDGVAVYFLFDAIGSLGLSSSYVSDLQKYGIRIRSFRTTKHFLHRFRFNFRNHRKILVTDGKVAFVGGHNVSDEYVGNHPKYGRWRDTHIKVAGPVVGSIQRTFAQDWFWVTGEALNLRWDAHSVADPGVRAISVATGPIGELDSYLHVILQMTQVAQKRLWISSPYFVPDDSVSQMLQQAALRGVDVRLLLPDNPDHLFVYYASFPFIEPLLHAGVTVCLYKPGFMHQKALVVDDRLSMVGTGNLDIRSFSLNFEISVFIDDEAFTADVIRMFENDFEGSQAVDIKYCHDRGLPRMVASQVARLFAPIL